MGLKEGCGAEKAKFGGRDFKSSGGKVNFLGKSEGKAVPKTALPSGGGGKKGQSFYLGEGSGRGIPKKGGSGGWNSKQAAMHD